MDGVNGGSGRSSGRAWAQTDQGYEHSLLTSGEKIQAYLDEAISDRHKDSYAESLRFRDDGTPQGGTAAGKVSMRFSQYKTAVFDYDAASGKYLVSQFGEAYIDGNTGEQVGVTNVLALKTRIRLISGDTAGRHDGGPHQRQGRYASAVDRNLSPSAGRKPPPARPTNLPGRRTANSGGWAGASAICVYDGSGSSVTVE